MSALPDPLSAAFEKHYSVDEIAEPITGGTSSPGNGGMADTRNPLDALTFPTEASARLENNRLFGFECGQG